jgi:hypothetical protein
MQKKMKRGSKPCRFAPGVATRVVQPLPFSIGAQEHYSFKTVPYVSPGDGVPQQEAIATRSPVDPPVKLQAHPYDTAPAVGHSTCWLPSLHIRVFVLNVRCSPCSRQG